MFDRMAGGVERMAILLMNAMVERGHSVSLFTWDRADAQAYYPMHPSIEWRRLNLGDGSRRAGWSLRAARMRHFRAWACARRPDVVVAFQDGPFMFAALSLLGTRTPIVLAERNPPHRFDQLRATHSRRATFPIMRLARAITVQFESYIASYPRYLRSRMVAIPNPVFGAAHYATPGAERSRYTLLSVGRLSYEKHYAVLLRAFALVSNEFPAWQLKIVGEGEERRELESIAAQLGIEARVSMPGAARDVESEYLAADLFCLTSRWEGFPNALAEAMAHGVPAVGFRACPGVNELVQPGRNGALADGNGDPHSLAVALRTLMGDAKARARMGLEARRIADAYRPERVFDDWERLFHKVASVS